MQKISILYYPTIDDEESKILADAFGADMKLNKFEKKGIVGGAFDIEIMINIAGGIIAAGLYDLIKNLFTRNRKKIMDNNSRPRYTILVLRMETKWITISNTNDKNKLKITKASAHSNEFIKIEDEYSDIKLSEYLKD